MDIIDYGQSFIQGRAPANRVRFWVESRTRIIDDQTGAGEDFYQCGACKSEDTFAEKNLFYEDNYDFIPIFSKEDGVIFRRHAYLNEDYRSICDGTKMWGGPTYDLVEPPVVQELSTNAEIRAKVGSIDALPSLPRNYMRSTTRSPTSMPM